jgi:hypothetical protein
VGTRKPFHSEAFTHRVETAAGSTVGVSDKDSVVTVGSSAYPLGYRFGDPVRFIVVGGGKTFDINMV